MHHDYAHARWLCTCTMAMHMHACSAEIHCALSALSNLRSTLSPATRLRAAAAAAADAAAAATSSNAAAA